MRYADMHCDTFSVMLSIQNNGKDCEFFDNSLQISGKKLLESDCALQNFAMYLRLPSHPDPTAKCLEMIALYDREMEKNSDIISRVYTYSDIENNLKAGKRSAMLTIEEGGTCRGSLDTLRMFYDKGVRMLTLTWNFENELGFSSAVSQDLGLKDRGFEFVEAMQDMGMIVDVSHLSDKGFYDVLSVSKKPIAASHSNARAMMNHRRNLTDDMIKRLADNGGITGLNYYGCFLSEDKASTAELTAKHARYIANLGGVEVLGLGSDFDGFDGDTEFTDCTKVGILIPALKREGFTDDEIDKIMLGNVLRVYKDCLK